MLEEDGPPAHQVDCLRGYSFFPEYLFVMGLAAHIMQKEPSDDCAKCIRMKAENGSYLQVG